tara:strand:- start:2949 stop:3245 length:297 start_codon:yes stop_codon:yes gene_type:complete
MFIYLVTFNLDPKYRTNALGFRDIFAEVFKGIDGFVSADFFRDEETQEAGGFTVWETEEAANAALEKLQTLLQRTIGGSGDGSFSMRRLVHTLRVEKE